MIFPFLRSLCVDIEKKKLKGCQLLDYITHIKTGTPVISTVIDR